MNLKEIKALYKFLKGTDIMELEVEDKNGKLSLKREGAGGAAAPVAQPAYTPPPPVSEAPGEAPDVVKKAETEYKVITSPMVGTFYRSPSPEASSFIETGGRATKGQVLCIIEAMKIMNEVESDFTGRVVSILVENGQPVEYGEPLFYIDEG